MIRTRFFKIGTIALLAGIPGCGSEAPVSTASETTTSENGGTVVPELGVSLDGLGAKVNSCNDGSGAGSSGNYDTTSKTMTVTLASGSSVFSVVGAALTVNGWPCFDVNKVALTTANVKKINITTTASATNKIVFDLLPGSFAPIFSTTGGVVIDFKDSSDTFAIRGDKAANKMKIGESGGSLFVEASGDTKADIKLKGTIPGSTLGALTFLLGDGNDEFDGIDVAMLSATHIDTAATALNKLPSTYKLAVYGGEGDDKLRGGLGNDTLYGNNGNDTFLTDKVTDGNDTYVGGAGSDTVSYADRTATVTADISPTGYSLTGTVDLTGLTWDGSTSRSAVITYDTDGDGAIGMADTSFTFVSATATTVAQAVAQWNTTTSKPPELSFAVNAKNKLVVRSTLPFSVGSMAQEAALGVTGSVLTTVIANDGEGAETDDINSDVENLTGGKGDDTLLGNDVSNKIVGGAGKDTISGGIPAASCATDIDSLDGGDGDDKFLMGVAGDCADEVVGGLGSDLVDYQWRIAALKVTLDNAADDGLTSEADNIKSDVEEVLGGSAADVITGGTGNETLHGGAGDDVISGGAGDDVLIGNAGNDTLNGAAGNDTFKTSGTDAAFAVAAAAGLQGAGRDVMNGGLGDDKIDYSARIGSLNVTLCTDAAVASGPSSLTGQCADSDGAKFKVATGNVDLSAFPAGVSSLMVNFIVTATDPAAGAIAVTSGGVDISAATDEATLLSALNNATTGIGGGIVASVDASHQLVLTGPEGVESITVTTNAASTAVFGTVANTTTYEGDNVINIEWLSAGAGNDTINGDTAGETIEGGAGTDTIHGGAGDDTIFGDNGVDSLYGDGGNDVINGGDGSMADGNDNLFGGAGDADICQALASDVVDASCEQK